MIVFSNALHAFSKRLEELLKDILENDIKVKVGRSRFLYKNLYYPIQVATFESKNIVGRFDPKTYQIHINKNLIIETKTKTLKDILRHELIHYLCYIEHGDLEEPHGKRFFDMCNKYSYSDDVASPHIDLSLAYEKIEGDLEAEKIFSKIKNLLKLAESSNPHEAELATLKANELLFKYNIEKGKLHLENDEEFYVHTLLSYKKNNAKLIAIYDIIKHFLVSPILRYSKNEVSLEVSGSKENIELAEYVAQFLDTEFERLWLMVKKENPNLQGLKDKNSFFKGIAKGYDEKIQGIRKASPMGKELILLENKLKDKVKLYYRSLSQSKSSSSHSKEAFQKGSEIGKSLSVNKAIKETKGIKGYLC